MNKRFARIIADEITKEQLDRMFDRAEAGVIDWTARSSVNSSFTKGTAWNILSKCSRNRLQKLAIKNMVWEFGDFIADEFDHLNPKKNKIRLPEPVHQEPKFNQ